MTSGVCSSSPTYHQGTAHSFLDVIGGLLNQCHMSSGGWSLSPTYNQGSAYTVSHGIVWLPNQSHLSFSGCSSSPTCHQGAAHPFLHVIGGCSSSHLCHQGATHPFPHPVLHVIRGLLIQSHILTSSISSSLLYESSSLAEFVYGKGTKWFR